MCDRTVQRHFAVWHFRCASVRDTEILCHVRIEVPPKFDDRDAEPATMANKLNVLCISVSTVHSIVTENDEENPKFINSKIHWKLTIQFSLYKSNPLDFRVHWTASQDSHSASDRNRKILNLKLDKCMDVATMQVIPWERLSVILMAAFLLRPHNRQANEWVSLDDRFAQWCRWAKTNSCSDDNQCHPNATLFHIFRRLFESNRDTRSMHALDLPVRVDFVRLHSNRCPTLNTEILSCAWKWTSENAITNQTKDTRQSKRNRLMHIFVSKIEQ